MAGFKAHLTSGAFSGIFIASTGFFSKTLTPVQVGAIFIVGAVAGLLPDLDSDVGKPLNFLFQLLSVLIPSILFPLARQYGGGSPEFLICYFAISYILINYLASALIQKFTVHRGIMHSFPYALLCGGLSYIFFIPSGSQLAVYGGLAVLSGCLVHLVLDEISSIKLKFGFIPLLKRSSGTSFKLRSKSTPATFFIYILIVTVISAMLYLSR